MNWYSIANFLSKVDFCFFMMFLTWLCKINCAECWLILKDIHWFSCIIHTNFCDEYIWSKVQFQDRSLAQGSKFRFFWFNWLMIKVIMSGTLLFCQPQRRNGLWHTESESVIMIIEKCQFHTLKTAPWFFVDRYCLQNDRLEHFCSENNSRRLPNYRIFLVLIIEDFWKVRNHSTFANSDRKFYVTANFSKIIIKLTANISNKFYYAAKVMCNKFGAIW